MEKSKPGDDGKIRVEQHIPGCVDAKSHTAYVETLEDVFAIPWVKQWSDDATFHRWSKSYPYSRNWVLMAEMDGGASWWVVAYLYMPADVPIDLPLWKEPKVRRAND